MIIRDPCINELSVVSCRYSAPNVIGPASKTRLEMELRGKTDPTLHCRPGQVFIWEDGNREYHGKLLVIQRIQEEGLKIPTLWTVNLEIEIQLIKTLKVKTIGKVLPDSPSMIFRLNRALDLLDRWPEKCTIIREREMKFIEAIPLSDEHREKVWDTLQAVIDMLEEKKNVQERSSSV